MPTTERISFPGPTRRVALGPHTDSLCRPLEPGESVEVVNEGERQLWLCVDAWTMRSAIEATRQRDEARAEVERLRAGVDLLLAEAELLKAKIRKAESEANALAVTAVYQPEGGYGLSWQIGMKRGGYGGFGCDPSEAEKTCVAAVRRAAGLDKPNTGEHSTDGE